MIGISVSRCIASMAKGEVDPATVEKIVGGTAADSPAIWDKVIADYKATWWRDFPEKAEELIRRFIAEGRVEQPRLTCDKWPYSKGEIFLESEGQIVLKGFDGRYE